MVMVLIYSPLSSPRLTYVVDVLAGLLPGTQWQVTNNKDAFLSSSAAKINYSGEKIDNSIQIIPKGLLWEDEIYPQTPDAGNWQGHTTLFPTPSDIPFDVFGAIFFLVTRYEEYYVDEFDQHGRFKGKMSIAHKFGFLEVPIVNIWANEFRKLLNARFDKAIPPLPYQFVPTIDIDQVYYYKHKQWVKNILGGAQQLMRGRWVDAWQRISASLGLRPDPNDTFEWLENTHRKSRVDGIYFFHVGKQGAFDPTPQYGHKDVLRIIKAVSSKNKVGLHPSYNSFNNSETIIAEKLSLEKMTDKPITDSRQHYLRFRLPETFRVLANCGITNEYSMGYADIAGYRASIAAPYKWYDLEKNEPTTLTIHPFAVMDVTLKNYMQLSPKTAIETIKKLIAPVEKHGGTFMSLWHNESVGKHSQWKGWREVYEEMMRIGDKNEN